MIETNEPEYEEMSDDEIDTLNLSEEQTAVIYLNKAIAYCGGAISLVVTFEERFGQKFEPKKPSDTLKAILDSIESVKRARELLKGKVAQLGGTLDSEMFLENKTDGFDVS